MISPKDTSRLRERCLSYIHLPDDGSDAGRDSPATQRTRGARRPAPGAARWERLHGTGRRRAGGRLLLDGDTQTSALQFAAGAMLSSARARYRRPPTRARRRRTAGAIAFDADGRGQAAGAKPKAIPLSPSKRANANALADGAAKKARHSSGKADKEEEDSAGNAAPGGNGQPKIASFFKKAGPSKTPAGLLRAADLTQHPTAGAVSRNLNPSLAGGADKQVLSAKVPGMPVPGSAHARSCSGALHASIFEGTHCTPRTHTAAARERRGGWQGRLLSCKSMPARHCLSCPRLRSQGTSKPRGDSSSGAAAKPARPEVCLWWRTNSLPWRA